MTKQDISTNSFKAWYLASRPKTLTGAAAPILIALSAAWKDLSLENRDFLWLPGLLCLAFALLMQIDANFINDYFDFKKGVDTEERLGPKRACAQGWITLKANDCTLLSDRTSFNTVWRNRNDRNRSNLCCLQFFVYNNSGKKRIRRFACYLIFRNCTGLYHLLHSDQKSGYNCFRSFSGHRNCNRCIVDCQQLPGSGDRRTFWKKNTSRFNWL